MSFFLAVVTVPLTQPNGPVDLPLTATSGVNDEVIGTSANRAGVGPVSITLYLHNNPSPPVGTTTAQNEIAMNTTAPTAATLYKYSTDLYNPLTPIYPGRYLVRQATTPPVDQASTGSGGAGKMVNWVYQVPTSTLFEGNGSVRLWVAAHDQNCAAVSLHYYIRRKNNANSNTSGTTLLSEGNMTVPAGGPAPCAFTQVDVPFTLAATTIPTNNWIELKVVVNQAPASADNALIAYDTSSYPSRLIMPQVTL